MEVQDKLTVQEWEASSTPRPKDPSGSTNLWLSPALLGVLGTCLFHLVLITSLGALGGRMASAPTKPDLGRMYAAVEEGPLELLSLGTIPRSRELHPDIRPPSAVIDNAPLLLKPPPAVNTERLALEDEEAASGNSALAEAAEIYDRQIHARIERVWEPPQSRRVSSITNRAEVNQNGTVQCQAQLEQDDRGNVLEVLLPVCNGSSEWRESLLTAIRQASPLPAPPDPRVFSSSLVLHFTVPSSVASERAEIH